MKKDSKTQPPARSVKVVRRTDRNDKMLKSDQSKSEKQNLLNHRRFLLRRINQIDVQLKGENTMSDKSNKNKPTMKDLFDLSFKANDLTPEEKELFGRADFNEIGTMAVGVLVQAAKVASEMDIVQDYARVMRHFEELTDTSVKIPAEFRKPIFVPAIIDATDKEM